MDKQTNNFDALRLTAALLVLVSHQFALSGRPEPGFAAMGLSLGRFSVLVFFAISGFLVTASWRSDPNLLRFAARRLLRLWPALAVMLAVCISLIAAMMVEAGDGGLVAQVVTYLLPNFVFFWSDGQFFQGNPVAYFNGQLWSVGVEMQCYVALAAIGLVARDRLRLALVAVAAILVGLYFSGRDLDATGLPILFKTQVPVNMASVFLAGALACVVPLLLDARVVAGVVALGVGCALAGLFGLAIVLLVPFVVVFVGRLSWPVLRRAGRYGDLSYGIYLWTWPVEQVVVKLLGTTTPVLALLAATLCLVLPLAWCSWHFIERRALAFKPRRRLASSPVAAA